MSLRQTLSLCILIALLELLGSAKPVLSQPIEMELGIVEEMTGSQDLIVAYVTKLIEERSHGRIRISQPATAPTLAERPLNWLNRQPRRLALQPMNVLARQIPALGVYELPFLCPDVELFFEAIKNQFGRPLASGNNRDKLVLLSVWPRGINYLASDIPVLSPGTVNAAIYTGDSRNLSSTFFQRISCCSGKEQQTAPRPIWQETTLPEFVDAKNPAQLRHVTLSRHRQSAWALLTSEAFWQQLPEDLRIIMLDAGADAAVYARELADRAESKALTAIRSDQQIQVHELSSSQWQQWHLTLMKFYDKLDIDEGAKELRQILKICSVH